MKDDPHDVFAPFSWAIEYGALSPAKLLDLLDEQAALNAARGVDRVSIPLNAARQIVDLLRLYPKGRGQGAGKAPRSPNEQMRRIAIVRVAELRRDELRAKGRRDAARLAAHEAEALAISNFGITDLSAGTILRAMRSRGPRRAKLRS